MLDNKYYYQKPQKFFPFSWKKKPQNLISPICPFNQRKNVHSGHKITGWNGGASKIVLSTSRTGSSRNVFWNVPSAFRCFVFPSCISSYTRPPSSSPPGSISAQFYRLVRGNLEERTFFLLLLPMEREGKVGKKHGKSGGGRSFIVHVQGLIFRPNARYSCSTPTIFVEWEGNIWQMHRCRYGPERETRILVTKTGWINLSFDPPQFRLMESKGFHSRVSFILHV